MRSDPIVIAAAARTPIGGLLGDFAQRSAAELGAVAIRAAVERSGVAGERIDEALMGCCLMAGQGQAPARQAMRGASEGSARPAPARSLTAHARPATRRDTPRPLT